MAFGLVNNGTRREREELHADILTVVFLLCVSIFRAISGSLFACLIFGIDLHVLMVCNALIIRILCYLLA